MRRYYEFALVVVILGLISLFLLQRLNGVRDEMEEATVQSDVASMQMQLLERIAHRETFGGTLPASENPVDWLPSPPRAYLGALDQVPAEVSVWYFDRRQKMMVYRFRDGHSAVFRLNRNTRQGENKGVFAGVSLQRQADQPR
jgi:hypothetical protein